MAVNMGGARSTSPVIAAWTWPACSTRDGSQEARKCPGQESALSQYPGMLSRESAGLHGALTGLLRERAPAQPDAARGKP